MHFLTSVGATTYGAKTLLEENREHCGPYLQKNETYIHDYRSQLRRELDDGLRGIPKQRNQTGTTELSGVISGL